MKETNVVSWVVCGVVAAFFFVLATWYVAITIWAVGTIIGAVL